MENTESKDINNWNRDNKKGFKRGLFLFRALLVLISVLFVGSVTLQRKSITNFLKKTFMTPEKYYRSVEKAAFASDMKVLTAFYERESKTFKKDQFSQSAELSLQIGEALKNYIKQTYNVDIYQTDRISVNGRIAFDGTYLQSNLTFSDGKKELIAVNGIMDTSNRDFYFQVPQLKREYGVISGRDTQYLEELALALTERSDLSEALPKRKDVEALLIKYYKTILSAVTSVRTEKGELTAEGITQPCTVLKSEIPATDLAQIMEKIADELKQDKQMALLLGKLYDVFASQDEEKEETSEEMQDDLRYFSEELRKAAERIRQKDIGIGAVLYVDGKGTVRGREITLRIEDDIRKISVYAPYNSGKIGLRITIEKGEDKERPLLCISGSGERAWGKISGNYSVSLSGMPVLDFSVKDFSTFRLKRGYFNAELTIKPNRMLQRFLPLRLPTSADNRNEAMNPSNAVLTLGIKNGAKSRKYHILLENGNEMLLNLTMALNNSEKVGIRVPTQQDTVLLEDAQDIREWLRSFDWDKLKKEMEGSTLPDNLWRTVIEFFKRI